MFKAFCLFSCPVPHPPLGGFITSHFFCSLKGSYTKPPVPKAVIHSTKRRAPMTGVSRNIKGSIIYFSHGGGPLPILGDASHEKMTAFMKELPPKLNKPEAVVVISAHWEEKIPTLIGKETPPLLYDYYGFPDEAYDIVYPAPGHPDLALKIQNMLENEGITAKSDLERGFDHGLFIPLKMMYPMADIPMTQLSLVRGLDPGLHVTIGKALRPLLQENILFIGSGFSFHNMRAFTWNNANEADAANDAFQNWLIDACCGSHDEKEREKHLTEWTKAPHARYCHPREEHLLPLHVCFGLSGNRAEVIFDDYILGKRAVAFRW